MEYKRILVAVNDSPFSIKAAQAGFAMAHMLKAEIGIIFVVDRSKEEVNPDLGITATESKKKLMDEAEKTIQQYINIYSDIEKISRFTPEGDPEKEILNIAKLWEANLIVLGTHGRSGISRLFAGSVAEHVIRNAEIPVMVIPPKMK